MKRIQVVPLSRMEEMRKYLNQYLIELSEFDPDIKFDAKGLPVYKWFDCYWEEKNRYPLYYIVDNNIAGFAMIRELEDMKYEIAEFYVLPQYRKDGNAINFATEVSNLFAGEFVFSTRFTNPRAIRFWTKFVSLFKNDSFFDDDIRRSWTIRKKRSKQNILNLNPEYFELIKNGEKVLEGRLNDEKRKQFLIGDEIVFYKEPERKENFKAIITDKLTYESFYDMAEDLDKEKLGFANKSTKQMIETYHSFYSQDDIHKYGVIVFKIKVV